jgi:hypothetical protein
MAARSIIPARNFQTAPDVQSHAYATGQTFVAGAALALSSGEVIEATSPITGATLFGFAAEKVASKPGWDAANSPTVITNRVQEVSVYRATSSMVFSGALVNNSATVIAPAAADIGVNYGLKAYSGVWCVDKNLTAGDATVTIVDIDIANKIVYFKVMPARLIAP